MKRYSAQDIQTIRRLREDGLTYAEIQTELRMVIPKGSLSYLCKGVMVSEAGKERIRQITIKNRDRARSAAVVANRTRFVEKLEAYKLANAKLAKKMQNRDVQLVALAMLYLGEGAKWQKSRAPKLGSSNPEIICLYIDLLNSCYDIQLSQLRCRVQHRADQNSAELVRYWSDITGVPAERFYPSYVDKRTVGKVTQKTNYRGVCTVQCAGTHIQLELAEIAGIISSAMRGISSFG